MNNDTIVTNAVSGFFKKIEIGQAVLSVTWIEMIFRFILPVLAVFILLRLIRFFSAKLISRSKMDTQKQALSFRWLRYFIRFFSISSFIILAYFVMHKDFSEWYNGFLKLFQFEFALGGEKGTKVTIVKILLLIPIFYISSLAGKSVRKILDSSFFNKLGIEESKRVSAGNLIRYVVMILVFLFFLNTFIGINLSALGGLLVTLGIGIGFGLQNVIGNFFSGVAILFAQPIKEKDRILVDGYEGEVVDIRLLSTIVKTLQNEDIIVPNSKITNSSIYNYTYDTRKVLVKNRIGISYQADVDFALEVLSSISKRNPHVDKRFKPIVRVEEFGSSSINLLLISSIHDVTKRYDAMAWNNLEIWRKFKEESIVIPFPQVDVNLNK